METNQIIAIAGIGFAFIVLNAVLLGVVFFTQRKIKAINDWPSTSGTVTSSRIEEHSDSEGGTTDYAAVTYAYEVGGVKYSGSRISPGPTVGGTGADQVVARYPVNSQVTVFHNPQDPSDAVLEKKAPALMWLWIVLVAIDCVLCGAMPVIYWGLAQ